MQNDDLKLLAAYALFGIRTINTPNLENAAQRQLSKSRFGVFVTLYRNENEILLDDPNARQIHGCLGHWSNKYESMDSDELVAKMQQLVKDVRTKDDRRLNFATDVDQDASAVIEISFMNLPLREIDDISPETKTHFSNKKQGILVDSGSGKRATYLPGVFPNASWTYISQSLRQKAGLGRTAAARFYAYDTTVITFPVYEVLFSALSASYLRTDVAFFYLKHYNDFVPYEYNAATKEARVDMGEAVRNVACIGDVIGFAHEYKAAFDHKPILSNLEHYYQKWLKAPNVYRQASIFLIRAYHRMGVHEARIRLMSAQLYSALERDKLEPRFEMGEAVSVLAQVPVPRVKALKRALELMYERVEEMLYAPTTPLDNVFELNWQSQSVHQMFKMEMNVSRASWVSRRLNSYMDHALLLFSVFVKTAQRTIVRLDSLETNYLAVIYECMSNLDAVMVLSETHSSEKKAGKHPAKHDQLAMVHDAIRNQRLQYFAALRRGEYGLYYFKDGKTARLDITGHAISL